MYMSASGGTRLALAILRYIEITISVLDLVHNPVI